MHFPLYVFDFNNSNKIAEPKLNPITTSGSNVLIAFFWIDKQESKDAEIAFPRIILWNKRMYKTMKNKINKQ